MYKNTTQKLHFKQFITFVTCDKFKQIHIKVIGRQTSMERGTNSTRGPAQRSTLMAEPLGGTTPLALAQRGLGCDLALALASWFRLPHCFGGVLYYTIPYVN